MEHIYAQSTFNKMCWEKILEVLSAYTADEHLTCAKPEFTCFLLTQSAELLSLNGYIYMSLLLAGIMCGQMHFIFTFQN